MISVNIEKNLEFRKGFYKKLLQKLSDVTGQNGLSALLAGVSHEWQEIVGDNIEDRISIYVDKLESTEPGFYSVLEKFVKNYGIGNNSIFLPSIFSGAGSEYGQFLRKKYKMLSLKEKVDKFVSAMGNYCIPVKNLDKFQDHELDDNNIVLKFNGCIFDLLKKGPKNIGFCNYSITFFKEYFGTVKIKELCKNDTEKEACYYIIHDAL